jgi:hypothetical protein
MAQPQADVKVQSTGIKVESAEIKVESSGIKVESSEPALMAKVESLPEARAPIVESAEPSLLVENMDDLSTNTDNNTGRSGQKNFSPEISFKTLTRTETVPAEPVGNEPKLLLAIKLPNGSRVQRHFSPSNLLVSVLYFAEISCQLDFSGCEMVCDAPRALYRDLNITIETANISNRTILHIQIPDTE